MVILEPCVMLLLLLLLPMAPAGAIARAVPVRHHSMFLHEHHHIVPLPCCLVGIQHINVTLFEDAAVVTGAIHILITESSLCDG
jgi:hypothetical protein